MSFIHDIIKIKYIDEGYLPDYPYHMISDSEMVEAFKQYFVDQYPCILQDMRSEYELLKSSIYNHVDSLINTPGYSLPTWVYSYMLGRVVGPNSSELDIHDLLLGLSSMFPGSTVHNKDDMFTGSASQMCYAVSSDWLSKFPDITPVSVCDPGKYKCNPDECKLYDANGEYGNISYSNRPATLFGEPHVIKSIRLHQINEVM